MAWLDTCTLPLLREIKQHHYQTNDGSRAGQRWLLGHAFTDEYLPCLLRSGPNDGCYLCELSPKVLQVLQHEGLAVPQEPQRLALILWDLLWTQTLQLHVPYALKIGQMLQNHAFRVQVGRLGRAAAHHAWLSNGMLVFYCACRNWFGFESWAREHSPACGPRGQCPRAASMPSRSSRCRRQTRSMSAGPGSSVWRGSWKRAGPCTPSRCSLFAAAASVYRSCTVSHEPSNKHIWGE